VTTAAWPTIWLNVWARQRRYNAWCETYGSKDAPGLQQAAGGGCPGRQPSGT